LCGKGYGVQWQGEYWFVDRLTGPADFVRLAASALVDDASAAMNARTHAILMADVT